MLKSNNSIDGYKKLLNITLDIVIDVMINIVLRSLYIFCFKSNINVITVNIVIIDNDFLYTKIIYI